MTTQHSTSPISSSRGVSLLTLVFLFAIAFYLLLWYVGAVHGNFPLLLFITTSVCGLYWCAERWIWQPRRQVAAEQLTRSIHERNEKLLDKGITPENIEVSKSVEKVLAKPWWTEWTADLFPVLLVVFLLRSFVAEPFKIPSGSMLPTLWVGDLILVNKWEYGLKLPVLNTQITKGQPVKRGDVIVFRYPPDPTQDYIKRVVGLPGDEIDYNYKTLSINGKVISQVALPDPFFDEDSLQYAEPAQETFDTGTHTIMMQSNKFIPPFPRYSFPYHDHCVYSAQSVHCRIPAGNYFVMGDNRDNSEDSRYWGFVPEGNIVGRAFFIWMNFSHPSRIGRFH